MTQHDAEDRLAKDALLKISSRENVSPTVVAVGLLVTACPKSPTQGPDWTCCGPRQTGSQLGCYPSAEQDRWGGRCRACRCVGQESPLHRVSHVRLAERNRGRKTSVGAVVRHAATDGSTPTSGAWGTPPSLRVVDCTLVTRFASSATLEGMRVNMTRWQHGETEMMLLAGA
jgi:hypothetical protein